jgi:flagellum-specific peptidoglycan hydrolase FlgJ
LPTLLQTKWLQGMVSAARITMHEYGVPASVTLAQCILESSWGQSQLARRANNYFGVKALQGKDYMEFTTREVVQGRSVLEQAAFARYPSPFESFEAHGKLLATLPRYSPAMLVRADPVRFCEQLFLCGYSTDSHYPERLTELIDMYQLRQYDITPPDGDAKSNAAPAQAKQEAA